MMNFLEDNLLIICPNTYKKRILQYLSNHKLILDIKFMSMEEYIKKIKFDYDVHTVHYLVQKGLKVDNAKTILDNLKYLENKDYTNEKLSYLQSIKKELDEHNLLIYDDLFSKMIEKRKIVIYGYGQIDEWKKSLFVNPIIIDYLPKHQHFTVYPFLEINDEVEMVFQKIVDLLKEGISINNIYLMNVDSEYLPVIKRYSLFYQIPIVIKNNATLMGTKIGEFFWNLVQEKKNKEDIFREIEKYQNDDNYANLIHLLNKYVGLEIGEIQEEIKQELLQMPVKTKIYENVLQVKNVYDDISDDEYVFLMNFNNPIIPKLSLDIDYITDNIKDLVGLPKVDEVNCLVKKNTIHYLESINHLIISYKKNTPFNSYYPSILLDDMDYELKEYQRSYNYSHQANQSLYNVYLDNYLKFGFKNQDLDLLYSNYGENNFMTYTNDFSGIDQNTLFNYLPELTLSYSSIDHYYKCGFRYYLSDILKIDVFEETFTNFVGNVFHHVLRHMNDIDFDFEYYYWEKMQKKIFTNQEQFFLNKLKEDLKYVIEVIKKHQFITGFNQMLYEQKIDIPIKKSPYVHFKGYVDKIMYQEKNNETFVSIIDYKTYEPKIDIKNLEFGLSMQLPIYLYLVQNSNLFQNPHFAGFYLQHILNINIKKDKKSAQQQKYDNLKLVGYSSNDLLRMSLFDSTYADSEMIRGMKLNKDGTLPQKGIYLSDKEIDKILSLTKEKIMEAMDNILKGHFSVNPKMINGNNMSCEYCNFRSICYREDKNYVYLKREEEDDDTNTGTETSD